MDQEKRLLTEDIAWKDLMSLKGSQSCPGTLILMILAGALCSLLTFISIFMLEKSEAGWLPVLILALAVGLVTGVLYRRYQAIIRKTTLEKMDVEAMVFDTDVCTNKYREDDGDSGYIHYLSFDKAGLIDGANVERIPGLPTYDDVSLGDRFFTVRLRNNPKIIKYYSFREWCLGELQED